MTDSAPGTPPAGQQPQPLAVRRLKKLRLRHPDDTPEQLVSRVSAVFIRDFTLVGGVSAGAEHFTPGAVGRFTRNPKIALATRAAAHLGSAGQKIAGAGQSAQQGVNTAAHVGSAQAIKTYVHALALLHGRQVADAEDAAEQLLGGGVNDLLAALDAPRQSTPQDQSFSLLGAIGVFAARNPQAFLLIKAGEQLAKTGSAVLTNSKERKLFAASLVEQLAEQLGEPPADFPQFLSREALKDSRAKASDIADDADTLAEEGQGPGGILAEGAEQTKGAPPVQDPIELPENHPGAIGARLAARAYMKARGRMGR